MNFIPVKNIWSDRIIPEEIRAAGLLPVLAYSDTDKLFLMDDQCLGFSFMCHPLTGADEKLQDRLTGMLNGEFPAGMMLQFALYRSPDIQGQLDKMSKLREHYHHPVLSTVVKDRISFLDEHSHKNLRMETSVGTYDNGVVQDLKLVVSCKVPIASNEPSAKEISELAELKGKLKAGLEVINVGPRIMNATDYIRFVSGILNWGKDASWKSKSSTYETDRTINEQLFDPNTQVDVETKHLVLGDQYVKVLSAKRLPESYFFGDALRYVGDLSGGNSAIKENYMIVTNIIYPDAEKFKVQLERKRHFTINQAFGPMTNFVPVLADKKEGFDLLHKNMKEGSKPFKISYSLVLFASSRDLVEAASVSARNIWREHRYELMEDKFIQLPMFINCLPLCSDKKAINDLFRYKTVTAESAAVIVPLFGEWKGTGTFHTALISRNGQLMSLSLHDSQTNKNAVIVAESGSGKSFLANELLTSYMSEGAQVWVIDAGKSYEKLCETLDGDFIHFEEGTKVCLNPFELVDVYNDEEDGLVGIVSNMASPSGVLSELQLQSLKKLMREQWDKHGKDLKIDHIADACLGYQDQRVTDIGKQLYSFTSKGGYGRYFSGKNNINFRNQFTVLELDELQGRVNLRQVVLLQLIYQIQQEIYRGNKNRKKIVLIDEAWDLLSEGQVAKFMEHAYRKFRKYGGSAIIATQSANDLYKNDVGKAIAENSATMLLLGQKDDTIDSVKKAGHLSLTDGTAQLLKTIHTFPDAYSEIYIKTNAGNGIGRLIVSNFQKLLYSTAPQDVQAISDLRAQGFSVPDAINEILKGRGLL